MGTTTTQTAILYYYAEKDNSECPPPNCGGYFLTAFGHWGERHRTRCADGRWRKKCYVAEVDVSLKNMESL